MASAPKQLETMVVVQPLRFARWGKFLAWGAFPRKAWTGLGLFFLVLGVVGIYLPGIPTTGPLILASYLFGKGNPELRQRMLQSTLLAPYRSYLDGTKPLTWALRGWAMLCMWLSIAISCWVLSLSAATSSIGTVGCVLGGVLGTVVILLYRSGTTPSACNADGRR